MAISATTSAIMGITLTIAGLLFLFFTVSEVDVLLDSLPFWPLKNLS